jgi:hypothetical protein
MEKDNGWRTDKRIKVPRSAADAGPGQLEWKWWLRVEGKSPSPGPSLEERVLEKEPIKGRRERKLRHELGYANWLGHC